MPFQIGGRRFATQCCTLGDDSWRLKLQRFSLQAHDIPPILAFPFPDHILIRGLLLLHRINAYVISHAAYRYIEYTRDRSEKKKKKGCWRFSYLEIRRDR